MDKAIRVANKALAAAERIAQSYYERTKQYTLTNRIESIALTDGYAGKPDSYVVVGDWNDLEGVYERTHYPDMTDAERQLPKRLERIFEKLGIECAWDDMVCTCDSCGRLIEMEPDNFGWKPFYRTDLIERGEMVCLDCEPYPDEIEDDSDESEDSDGYKDE